MARRRGVSLDTLLVELLSQAVDVDAKRRRLARYATWTDEDFREFDEAFTAERAIRDGDWR